MKQLILIVLTLIIWSCESKTKNLESTTSKHKDILKVEKMKRTKIQIQIKKL